MRLATLLLAIQLAATAGAQEFAVAPYYGARKAALSLTFDDGLLDQYTLAYPHLRRLGLKATFGLVGSRMETLPPGHPKATFTWAAAREMADEGQEMASHTYTHRNVTTLPPDTLRNDLLRNDTAIYRHTGQRPLTLLYPGNRKSAEAVAICGQGRVCTRTFQISLGSKRTPEWFAAYLDSLIAGGQWGVTMTHGIECGYDCFPSADAFIRMLELAASLRDRLWVAPLRDVAAYRAEAAATELRVERKGRRTTVRAVCPLPATLYAHPLTITTPQKPHSVTAGGKSLKVTTVDGLYIFDLTPGQTAVVR